MASHSPSITRLDRPRIFLAACLAGLTVGVGVPNGLLAESGTSAIPQDPSRLLIIDCLLPGQVRKLGGQMTYLSPRRPVKTTASDCEIRGGEYVAYDRANYATALKVWMPQAQQGDPEAQTYVGEIFEKGLGIAPDYVAAAKWYQKAADQGYAKAQMLLAYLYEQGLGVQADPLQALNLYRRASGIEDDDLTFVAEVEQVRGEMQAEIDVLTQELERQNTQIVALQSELGASRSQVRDSRNALLAAERDARELRAQVDSLKAQSEVSPANLAQLRELEQELNQREIRLVQQQQRVASLEADAATKQADLSAKLAAAAKQDFALSDELKASGTENAALRNKLEAARRQLQDTEQQVARLNSELAMAQAALAADRERLLSQTQEVSATDQQRIASLSAGIKTREQELALKQQRIDELLAQQQSYIGELSGLRAELAASAKIQQTQASEIKSTRSQLASAQRQLLDTEQRLASLTSQAEADQARLRLERERLERQAASSTTGQQAQLEQLRRDIAQRDARLAQLQRTIVALEKEKQQYAAQVNRLQEQEIQTLATRSVRAKPPPLVSPLAGLPKEIRAARYHALIIGNNLYQNMPPLKTAVNDAKALDQLLRTRYGFKTRLLIDADRAQIVQALHEYIKLLEADDNLLIYYAGHGELDEGKRGYWLPVNAQPENEAEWISDRSVSDLIGRMNARHVMVVADSCYSGAMTRNSTVALTSVTGDQIGLLLKKAKLPSRTVMTSGGEAPVLDAGGGQHSIFAQALLEVLRTNKGVLEGAALYNAVLDPVRSSAARLNVGQSPRYSQLADAGHLNGEFLFVPQT